MDPDADADATAVLTGEGTASSGTEAETPHAIAHGTRSHTTGTPASQSSSSQSSPSQSSSASPAVGPDAEPRLHAFHLFGAVGPIAAICLSFVLGGDHVVRLAFWIGAVVVSLSNLALLWLTSQSDRYRERLAAVCWLASVIGVRTIIFYFGPFSGAVVIDVLGIAFVTFGKHRIVAAVTVAICATSELVMTMAIASGTIADRSLLTSAGIASKTLYVTGGLLTSLVFMGYLLGRWARRTNTAAFSELRSAMRILGDKEQALAEVRDDAARANRIDEGRWTGRKLGSFELGLVLGRGAMGEVYEAKTPTGEIAAVKLLNARSTTSTSLVERFHREMVVAARLSSPYIVRVLEISPPDARVPYITMERLNGTDLATRLRNENRIWLEELVVMLDQVGRGLEVARVAGVVHRDLKPHNLFNNEGGIWKILDFGVSKLMGDEGTLTGEGIVGTPQYMAPEQAAGREVTHAADIYALAAIAYRCITGRAPHAGKDVAELVYQVVHVPPAAPTAFARISPALEDVLAVAMAKDPRKRFPSALSFAQAFISARRGRAVKIAPPLNPWS